MLILSATSGGADWIGLKLMINLQVGVELDCKFPVVAEVLLGIGEVLVGGDHIAIELWSEVVVNILSWVVPFLLRCLSSELKFVGFHALGKLERSVVVDNVGVNTEVWNWVVDLVAEWLLLMLVLSATSRRADWIRSNVGIKLDCKLPMVAKILLGVSEVLVGGDHVAIKLWSEVVIDILGWVVPLFLGSLSSQYKLVGFHALGKFKRSVIVDNVSVNTKVWHWVVDLVSQWLLFVLVLGAASGGANWIGLNVGLNEVWRALSNSRHGGHGQNSHARRFLEHFYYK